MKTNLRCFCLPIFFAILTACSACRAPGSSSGRQAAAQPASDTAIRRFVLKNGYTVQLSANPTIIPKPFTDIPVYRGSHLVGSVPLLTLMRQWLHSREIWANHALQNSMVYMQSRGADFHPCIVEALPLNDRVLAVLSWQDQAGSGAPIKAQHLIQIIAGPRPTVKVISNLPAFYTEQPPPRLFAFRKRLLLFIDESDPYGQKPPLLQARLLEITPAGKTLHVAGKWRALLFPVRLVKGHTLELKDQRTNAKQPFWTYDLSRKRLHHKPDRIKKKVQSEYLPFSK